VQAVDPIGVFEQAAIDADRGGWLRLHAAHSLRG
jgi:hypothetical protein